MFFTVYVPKDRQLKKIINIGDVTGLRKLLKGKRPVDIAELFIDLSLQEQIFIIKSIPLDVSAAVVQELSYAQQAEIFQTLDDQAVRSLLLKISADDLVDLLAELSEEERERLLRLSSEKQGEMRSLLDFPENTAGGLMTTEFVTVKATATAEEAIELVRYWANRVETVAYAYVTSEEDKLIGVVSLRQLVISDPKAQVLEFMFAPVIKCFPETHQEIVAQILQKYDFVALPVVNHEDQLLGLVTIDDVIDVIIEEATEDLSRLSGTEPLDEPYLQSTVKKMVQKRVGWLLVLFVTASFTSSILKHFEDMLEAVVVLAFFIPLLIDTGGNTGSQSAALLIRALGVGEASTKDLAKIIWREVRVGIAMGSLLGIGSVILAYVLGGNMLVGITVGIALLLVVIMGAVIGAFLPMVAYKLKMDPAVVAGPFITTLVDSLGLLVYFSLALWIMGM